MLRHTAPFSSHTCLTFTSQALHFPRTAKNENKSTTVYTIWAYDDFEKYKIPFLCTDLVEIYCRC